MKSEGLLATKCAIAKRIGAAILTVVLGSFSAGRSGAEALADIPDSAFIANRVAMRFRSPLFTAARDLTADEPRSTGVRSDEVARLLRSLGATLVAPVVSSDWSDVSRNLAGETIRLRDLRPWVLVELAASTDRARFIQESLDIPEVLRAERIPLGQNAFVPNDPLFAIQWPLSNSGQTLCGVTATPGADIGVVGAWDSVRTLTTLVQVGVLDNGVGAAHPDLLGRVFDGWSCPTCGLSTSQYAPNTAFVGHGTAVASIIGGIQNNSAGIAGIDPFARIFSMKGGPLGVSPDDQAAALDWARQAWIPLINASQAGQSGSQLQSDAYYNAFVSGMFIAVAMGNTHGTLPYFPAAYSRRVFAVGALSPDGGWGNDLGVGTAQSDHGPHIDVCAPGWKLVPAANKVVSPFYFDLSLCPNLFGGTSAATPVVTGIAALLLRANAYLMGEDIEHLLRETAVDVTTAPASSGFDEYTGFGKVRADSALAHVLGRELVHVWGDSPSILSTTPTTVTIQNHDVAPALNGTHSAIRYRLQSALGFGSSFTTLPDCWVRSSGSNGTRLDTSFDDSLEVPWCGIVPGSLTNSGVNLETYVYEIQNGGTTIGWYPCTPQQATTSGTAIDIARDYLAPASITDLAVEFLSNHEITLRWTSPGDDGVVGNARDADLRISWSAITSDSLFAMANPVGMFMAEPVGQVQFVTIQNLAPCTKYYFAVKARDESGRWSPLGNSRMAKTTCAYGASSPAENDGGPSKPSFEVGAVVRGDANIRVTLRELGSSWNTPLEFEVFDVAGRVLGSGEVKLAEDAGGFEIQRGQDFRATHAGVVFVRLRFGGATSTHRIVLLP